MTSGLFRLGWNDLVKGLVVAVFAALIAYFSDPSKLNAIDWGYVSKIALTAALSYLGKNFVSSEDGKVFGKIG